MAEDSEKTCEYLKTKATTEPIASFLGTTLAELRPGYSRVTMTVREEFLNFNDVVFGGIIMSLADQAFAYGSNSLSHPSLAVHFSIQLLSTARAGDELTAECRVLRNGRRAGISEITVTNQEGRLVARASGTTVPVNTTLTATSG